MPSMIIGPATIGSGDCRTIVRSARMERSRMIDARLRRASRSVLGPLSAVESMTAISLFAISSAATASTSPAPEGGSMAGGWNVLRRRDQDVADEPAFEQGIATVGGEQRRLYIKHERRHAGHVRGGRR